MTSAPQAITSLGRLAGAVEQGVCVFRGVPYVQAPVGALRFAPPAPLAPWSGVRDASSHGPIPPQPPSRLRAVMGDFNDPQGEDCLTLTIATPAADGARRPPLQKVKRSKVKSQSSKNRLRGTRPYNTCNAT